MSEFVSLEEIGQPAGIHPCMVGQGLKGRGANPAELRGAVHRLMVVMEELKEMRDDGDLERLVRRLEYHVENYYVRLYELRERGYALARVHGASKGCLERVRSADTRHAELERTAGTTREVLEVLANLLSVIEIDVALRNRHTHEVFVRLAWIRGSDMIELGDASEAIEHLRFKYPDAEVMFRQDIHQCVDRYIVKIREVAAAGFDLHRWALEHPCGGTA